MNQGLECRGDPSLPFLAHRNPHVGVSLTLLRDMVFQINELACFKGQLGEGFLTVSIFLSFSKKGRTGT